jgi:hypothetical protein
MTTTQKPKHRAKKGWAIIGQYGLYTGWSRTRADAIASHIHDFYGCSRFAVAGGLRPDQREKWALRKARGDRAVKVEIRVLT